MRRLIKHDYLTAESDAAQLKKIIQQNILKIEDELTGNLSWYSQDARFVPGSMKIISIESLGNSRYKMCYSFNWNVFNACLDINATKSITENVGFEITPGALVFDFIDNQPPGTENEL